MSELSIDREDALLLVIDVQERLTPAMQPAPLGRMLENLDRWGSASRLLGIPTVVTEQYPKGLGSTVSSVRAAFPEAVTVEKMTFSAWAEPAVRAVVEETGRKTVLVAGIETHICVWQTVRDLSLEYHVHVLEDAVASRTDANYRVGLGLAERAGAVRSSTEVALFDLLGRAGSDEFKAISRLVR